jgi:hypothetical protein
MTGLIGMLVLAFDNTGKTTALKIATRLFADYRLGGYVWEILIAGSRDMSCAALSLSESELVGGRFKRDKQRKL